MGNEISPTFIINFHVHEPERADERERERDDGRERERGDERECDRRDGADAA